MDAYPTEPRLRDALRQTLDPEHGPHPVWTDSPAARRVAEHQRSRWPLRAIGAAAAVLVVAVVGWSGAGRQNQAISAAPPFGPAGNGVIALPKDGDILVADRPGGEFRPLVTGADNDVSPIFSPDGTKIAYTRGGSLMVADADGTNVTRLTPDTLHADKWSFAPDGRSLVGVGLIDGEPAGPACESGNTPRRVLIRPVDPAAPLRILDIPLWDSWMEVFESGVPRFRPTNPQQLIVVTALEPCGPRGIHVYDLATGAIRTLPVPDGYVSDVQWSPDGQFVSYDLMAEASTQSRVVAVDGLVDRPLVSAPTTTLIHQVSPWSNDGTRIVIERGLLDGRHGLLPAVVNTSGDGRPVELDCGGSTNLPCADSWIWSPDDSTLIGSTQIGPEAHTVLQADPETGEVRDLGWPIDLDDPRQWQRVAP